MKGVSILVIMELALEGDKCNAYFCGSAVSILVIMELALEEYLDESINETANSFNPCYYGIGFRRRFIRHCMQGATAFQSLLLWNWL